MAERMEYYRAEHEAAYERIEREGKSGWHELHGGSGFDHFGSRAHLERSLALLRLDPGRTAVLEYGCGTGGAACFLAARGFRVDAIDLIPRAIRMARRFAAERGLDVHFDVGDICALATEAPAKRYDLIVDSYCLQSIVLDEDRARLFSAVRARLKPAGYCVISTAMFDPARVYGDEELFDAQSGIVLIAQERGTDRPAGEVTIGGRSYLPHRRHHRPGELAAELTAAGFALVWQGGKLGGEVICRLAQEGAGTPESSARHVRRL